MKRLNAQRPTLNAQRSTKAVRRDAAFREVVGLIEQARGRAYQAVNTALIDLYWQVGEYISAKVETQEWGKAVIQQLADYLAKEQPRLHGFSASNLWRMKQFYETYRQNQKLAPLVRELSWTHNLLILGKCRRSEEQEFYLRLAIREHWSKRELERQLAGALFERAVLNPPKVSALLRELHPAAENIFQDVYLLDFLDLPAGHSEGDLQAGLVANLKRFLLELGRDFAFVGEQYLLQVGGKDYRLDLLFYHRGLQCLVAIELKVEEFAPEHLGKLEFYLEALDRDVRKAHERPSIGVLLCAGKDREVVEYALSRSVSPALIAEYQTRLPDRKLLQAKLHEFYELASADLTKRRRK
jgi:predicted nuclease of restriction endonuclease-like (RecB) superfamily